MVTCHEAIKEVMQEAKRIISAREVINLLYSKYPERPWKESTIYAHLYGCSINNPPAYTQHPSFPKFLFDHKRRKYELYDPRKHGRWNRGHKEGEEAEVEVESASEEYIETTITLERDLEEYIVRNINQIEDGLRLFEKEGINGRQYNTDVGRVDLLATDINNEYLVIELKAGVANYSVVGQILAYIREVRRNIAKGKGVRGIIIADDFDNKLMSAISEVPHVSLKKYRVNFTFEDVQK